MELQPSVARTSLPEMKRRLESLVSPFTGVVRGAVEFTRAPDDSHLFNFGCRLANPAWTIGAQGQTMSNAVHPDRDVAWVAAVAEAVERYSSFYRPDLGELATPASSVECPVAPCSFALFHDAQYESGSFPYVRFTDATPVRWTRGHSLRDQSPAMLPSQLVYLSDAPGEAKVAYATSSGTALGGTRDEAILSALLESVERDAFMLAWHNRLTLPRLDPAGEPSLLAEERRIYGPSPLQSECVDLTALTGVPTVVATLRSDRPGQPAFTVGAATALTLREAYRKAKREAYQTRVLARQLLRSYRSVRFAVDYADVTEFDHHILLHAQDRSLSTFLDGSPETHPLHARFDVEAESAAQAVSEIVRRLADQGVAAYYVDLTSPDVADAGLSVARVVCPELCRLDVAHTLRFLGGERLYTRPLAIGLSPERSSFDRLNPVPHPFP